MITRALPNEVKLLSQPTINQSSDAHIGGINLNNDDPYEVPTRSMGRDRAKRKMKGAQSSLSEDEERNRALKFFLTPGENLSDEDRRIFNNAKKDLVKEYNWDKT
ncbi:unnamed protein product [Lactuca saligna]|uniref:Uncharacterized protein n=1 Tax=Lactuca saligna TaxID=75948 RepID=A0AA36EJB0_LACSI|nr:unnamed protein product [Lactuca saligna]